MDGGGRHLAAEMLRGLRHRVLKQSFEEPRRLVGDEAKAT
jgi:hypothetical protein